MGKNRSLMTLDMTYIAIFAVVLAIGSWISIPTVVPFTLQTFGVLLAGALLGRKRGVLAVLVFLLLGALGLPVFAGFSGGLGAIVGPTGGYLVGFLFTAWIVGRFAELGRPWLLILGMVLGILVCYLFGTAWFILVYSRTGSPIGVAAALGMCVVPFLLPDLAKLILAFFLARRLAPFVKLPGTPGKPKEKAPAKTEA